MFKNINVNEDKETKRWDSFNEWFDINSADLWDEYVESIDYDRDSYESKKHRLNSDKCFTEWAEEKYDSK